MEKLVIVREFGARLAVAKSVIVVREQDIESSLDLFNFKLFKDFASFEKHLEEKSICILSRENAYNKLIKSLSV